MPKALPLSSDKFSGIKLLCCDVDGVMTDGGLYYNETGHCMIKFNVLDGMGLKAIRKVGIKTAIISMTKSPIIEKRAKVLDIDYCFVGIENKLEIMKKILADCDLSLKQVCHIADDINDIELLTEVGVSVTVPNAVDEIKNISHFITYKPGGSGAVRELCDSIIKSIKI